MQAKKAGPKKIFNRILLILAFCYSCFSVIIFIRISHDYSFFYPTNGKWMLVWDDDFNGPILDQSRWVAMRQSAQPLKEVQVYLYENVTVQNGCLLIASKKEDWTGPDEIHSGQLVTKHYTSGEVTTLEKAVWTYGRFEIRAKLPSGQGLSPFALLHPTDHSWPPQINIMAMVGHRPNEIYFDNYWGVDAKHQQSDGSGPIKGGDYSADFHIFALEWEPQKLRWYIDGVLKFQLERNVPNRPLCLVLGTSIGGIYAGDPYDGRFGGRPSSFPQYFNVDWVRVYQRR